MIAPLDLPLLRRCTACLRRRLWWSVVTAIYGQHLHNYHVHDQRHCSAHSRRLVRLNCVRIFTERIVRITVPCWKLMRGPMLSPACSISLTERAVLGWCIKVQ